ELARRMARPARHDPKPVHAPRRPAVGPAGVDQGRGRGVAPAGRAATDRVGRRVRRASVGRGRGPSVTSPVDVGVAVVGGGPAGALTAKLLARAGHDVLLVERAPAWRWRACGVFASPASVAALRRLGIGLEALAGIAKPLPAMEVVSAAGARFRMNYGGTGDLADSAVGFDRAALDPMLLSLAREAGAVVREGETVERVELRDDGASIVVRGTGANSGAHAIHARVVVGADGLRSTVARGAGVTRTAPLGPRAALTFHVPDVRAGVGDAPPDARMCVFDHGYVGLAPVPGGRVNVGIVLDRSWFARLRGLGGR